MSAEVSHLLPSEHTRLPSWYGHHCSGMVILRLGYLTRDTPRTFTSGLGIRFDTLTLIMLISPLTADLKVRAIYLRWRTSGSFPEQMRCLGACFPAMESDFSQCIGTWGPCKTVDQSATHAVLRRYRKTRGHSHVNSPASRPAVWRPRRCSWSGRHVIFMKSFSQKRALIEPEPYHSTTG